MPIVNVALDVPLDRLFDYECRESPAPGSIVVVPFGARRVVGVVVALNESSAIERSKIRSVHEVVQRVPALSAATLELLRFCSRYYHHPLGATIHTALPAGVRNLSRKRTPAPQKYSITPLGMQVDETTWPRSATVRRAVMAAFKAQSILSVDALSALGPRARSALSAFVDEGWVEACEANDSAPLVQSLAINAAAGPQLTPEQTAVVESIGQSFGQFRCHVLCGVTGSGKTEVYLRLIEQCIAAGKQSLLLVPEIGLTPQLEDALATRFGARNVATLHSAMAEGERLERWLRVAGGAVSIVAGTRLAVFAQIPQLGLIIVDEEHDASYKQQDGLRYSARDVAVVLGKQRNVPVVLGSATPSLESMRQALTGRYALETLTTRASGAPPEVEIVPMRELKSADGFSPALTQALKDNLERREQSLVFVNRRGFAPTLYCMACGWIAPCHRCSARLTVHSARSKLMCHYCGHEAPIPTACPACGNQDLRALGHGTQRIEQEIATTFPDARVMRIDRDTTRRRNAFQSMRDQVSSDAVDILVGTQMLAKGHDFPNLTLVAVVGADQGLLAADFRAEERLFALLLQVIGRAGRGVRPGRALVQTAFPNHPLFGALQTQDFQAFVQAQLATREAVGFPPFLHQVLIRAEATSEAEVRTFLEDAAQVGRAAAPENIVIYDPVPASMARLAGKWRWNLLVQSSGRTALHACLDAWLPQLRSTRVRWSVDVDPLEF